MDPPLYFLGVPPPKKKKKKSKKSKKMKNFNIKNWNKLIKVKVLKLLNVKFSVNFQEKKGKEGKRREKKGKEGKRRENEGNQPDYIARAFL